ncbi:PHP domain-containing protein [Clostridium sp. AN503]|uniref:PHP domain-containing protein n=1 Tax=Clostridium sp. AN503 TaxID=3160598 RepID=UPI00345AC3FA
MGKQKFNLHTHTARCGHAEGLDIQYIQSAVEAGFEMLGFSEHIPFVELRRPDCRMFYEHKEEYLSSIGRLQRIFSNQITIRTGYEVEYMEDHEEYLMQMRRECDYMILGQHCKFIGYEYDCFCSDEDVLFYTKQIEQALAKDFITCVAHPDYYLLGRRFFSKACEEAAHRIAKASIQYDVPLEINLNGFHYGKKTYAFYDRPDIREERYPYPFREFWEIAASYGCKVLYGYDAHTPIAFQEADRERKAGEILKGIPLNFVETIQLR